VVITALQRFAQDEKVLMKREIDAFLVGMSQTDTRALDTNNAGVAGADHLQVCPANKAQIRQTFRANLVA
jgi:hypothetical protein